DVTAEARNAGCLGGLEVLLGARRGEFVAVVMRGKEAEAQVETTVVDGLLPVPPAVEHRRLARGDLRALGRRRRARGVVALRPSRRSAQEEGHGRKCRKFHGLLPGSSGYFCEPVFRIPTAIPLRVNNKTGSHPRSPARFLRRNSTWKYDFCSRQGFRRSIEVWREGLRSRRRSTPCNRLTPRTVFSYSFSIRGQTAAAASGGASAAYSRAIRRSVLARTISTLESTVRKKGHREAISSRTSHPPRRRAKLSNAEPTPYQPGRMARFWVQANTQGMARRASSPPAARFAGR